MSKETELSDEQIKNAAGQWAVNVIGDEHLLRISRQVLAADRELRRGDAQMPVVAWYGLNTNGYEVVSLKENHVLRMFDAGEVTAAPLVLLSDAHAALAAQAVNAKRLTQAARDITTVLRVEGMDLEIGSRKLLKEARDAIDAAIAKEKAK